LRDEITAVTEQIENPSVASAAGGGAAMAVKPTVRKVVPGLQWAPIDKFSFDSGKYNSAWINIYVSLEGVGDAQSVACNFEKGSFDLQVTGLNGKNYRLFKDNLEHDIVAEDCKHSVKPNRVTLKIKKVKGEYSYDSWTTLTAKRKKDPSKKEDPSAGIMDMMKDMYDDGDENMKKVIGEAMLKSRNGDKSAPDMPSLDDD
jgi:calcyclin binding protein